MCLFPKIIKNRHYIPNKSNNFHPPKCNDPRKLWVPAACGDCLECRKRKINEWTIRCEWELKTNTQPAYGITFTFSDESLDSFNEPDPNILCQRAVRLFIKRWVRKFSKSPKYWLIPEIGQNNTERIHMHGIIWTAEEPEYINLIWQYGNTKIEKASLETIPYAMKYFIKPDMKHQGFKGRIISSKGIGKGFLYSTEVARIRKQDEGVEYVKNRRGFKTAVPNYWRKKILSDQERDARWTKLLDKETRYVLGERIDVSTPEGEAEYEACLKYYQRRNKELGFNESPWDIKSYRKERRNLERLEKKNQKKNCKSRKKTQPLQRKSQNKSL